MILSSKRVTKALIRLRGCECWSAPLLFAKPPKTGFLASGPIFILTNSAGTNEMLPFAAFHQGLHCLPFNLLQGTRMRQVEYISIHFDRMAKKFEKRRKGVEQKNKEVLHYGDLFFSICENN